MGVAVGQRPLDPVEVALGASISVGDPGRGARSCAASILGVRRRAARAARPIFGPARDPSRPQSYGHNGTRVRGVSLVASSLCARARAARARRRRRCRRGSRRRSPCRASAPPRRARSPSTSRPGRRSSRATPTRRSHPRRTRSCRSRYAALRRARRVVPLPHRGARRAAIRTATIWHGERLPEGLRRPDAHSLRARRGSPTQLQRAGSRASTDACSATSRGSTRAHRAGLEVVVLHQRVARRSRRSSSTATSTTATSRCSPALAAAGRFRQLLRGARDHRRRRSALGRAPAGRVRARADRVGAAPARARARWTATATTSRAEMLLKQLGAEAGDGGTTRRGRRGRRCATSRRPACRSPACAIARRLRPLARRPADGARARGAARRRLERPDLRDPFWAALPVGRRERHARGPHATRAGARRRAREDRARRTDASALSGYVRDRYAFAVLQNGCPVVDVVGAQGAGPVRDRARVGLSCP